MKCGDKILTDKHKLAYMLAGFQMAHKIVKDWLPTGSRTGSLMLCLSAREEAIAGEISRASRPKKAAGKENRK